MSCLLFSHFVNFCPDTQSRRHSHVTCKTQGNFGDILLSCGVSVLCFVFTPIRSGHMSLVLMAGDISALSQLSLQGSASDRGMSPAHQGPGLHIMGAQHKYQLGNNFVVRGLFVTTTYNPLSNYRNIVLNKGLSVPLPLQQK